MPKGVNISALQCKRLKEILTQRIKIGFNKDAVDDSAISLASAYSAKESGDARTALMLLERAGEIADLHDSPIVTEREVDEAKTKVEEEIIVNMISTLPEQVQLVLYSIADLTYNKKYSVKLLDDKEVLYSGDYYNEYTKICKDTGKCPVSTKWFKQYLDELELYGLIITNPSGKGVRGTTTLVKLGFDAKITYNLLKNQLTL
jgi:cell division control protein 6